MVERLPRLLDLAVRAFADWRTTGRSPRACIAEHLPPELPAAQRAEVARTVYAAIAWQRRLEFALVGVGDLRTALGTAADAALLLAARVARGSLDADSAAASLAVLSPVVLPFPAVFAVDREIDRVADPARRFGLRHSLPDWLSALLLAEFGAEAEAVAAALGGEPPRTIRANLLRVPDRSALAAALAEQGISSTACRHAPHGLQVGGLAPLFDLDAYRQGAFEQQDEGSQLVALAVAPPPRGKVLDACAGSGGKTLALAAALGNRGSVLAVDVHPGRVDDLRQRARTAGAQNVQWAAVPEAHWPEAVAAFARAADRILLDVPCSGVGALRRRPEARWSLQPAQLQSMQQAQAALIDRAAAALPAGARLVYATCTLFAAENEVQVAAALSRHPQLETVRLAEILGTAAAAAISDPTGTFLSLRPDRHGCDGFFAAVLRRKRG